MKPKRVTLIIILVLSLTAHQQMVFAAEITAIATYEEEVVVTATRLEQTTEEAPGMIEVITKAEIEASGAATVSELLTQKGFTVSTYGGPSGAASIRLDGGEAEHTLILVNGIPANRGTMGSVDLSYFPTAGIAKIEVVHGPLSALYGSNALGGVVNIITDLTGDPRNEVMMNYGRSGHNNGNSGEVAFTMQQMNYGLAFGGRLHEGYRENAQTGNYFLMYQYDLFQNADESLSLTIQSMAKDNESAGSLSYPTPEDKQQDTLHALSLTGKTYLLKGLWEHKTYLNYWEETFESADYGTDEYDNLNYGLDLAGLYAFEQHQLLLGLNLMASDSDSTVYGSHALSNAGFYLQDSICLTAKWQFTSGLRWETGSITSSPLTPKFSLVYLVRDDVSLKLGYGRSFRAPTIADLYYPYGGNPDLEPERGERYDLTGEWRKAMHSLSLNLYRSYLKDGIDWIWVGPTDWDYQAQNFEKINITGVNLDWKINWNAHLNSNLKYSWVDKERWDSTTASYVEDSFFGKHRLSLGLNANYGAVHSHLNWEYVWDRSDQSAVTMADYDLIHWRLSYLYNDTISYTLAIYNLTDEVYAIHAGYPEAGREYRISVNYRF